MGSYTRKLRALWGMKHKEILIIHTKHFGKFPPGIPFSLGRFPGCVNSDVSQRNFVIHPHISNQKLSWNQEDFGLDVIWGNNGETMRWSKCWFVAKQWNSAVFLWEGAGVPTRWANGCTRSRFVERGNVNCTERWIALPWPLSSTSATGIFTLSTVHFLKLKHKTIEADNNSGFSSTTTGGGHN